MADFAPSAAIAVARAPRAAPLSASLSQYHFACSRSTPMPSILASHRFQGALPSRQERGPCRRFPSPLGMPPWPALLHPPRICYGWDTPWGGDPFATWPVPVLSSTLCCHGAALVPPSLCASAMAAAVVPDASIATAYKLPHLASGKCCEELRGRERAERAGSCFDPRGRPT